MQSCQARVGDPHFVPQQPQNLSKRVSGITIVFDNQNPLRSHVGVVPSSMWVHFCDPHEAPLLCRPRRLGPASPRGAKGVPAVWAASGRPCRRSACQLHLKPTEKVVLSQPFSHKKEVHPWLRSTIHGLATRGGNRPSAKDRALPRAAPAASWNP